MAVAWLTPTDVTPGTDDAWTDVNVSGSVPAGATGVILHIEATANVPNDTWGVRKNGSTDNRVYAWGWTAAVAAAHIWFAIGVDANRVFEAYVDRKAYIKIWLVGYFTSDAAFFTNAPDKSLGSAGLWTDIDIAGDTGGDTAIAAIFEVVADASSYTWGFRKNGSTDSREYGNGRHYGALIGVDGSEICEGRISDTRMDFFLVGYLKSDATLHTNATNVTPATQDSWVDLTTLGSGATGGFYELVQTNYSQYTHGLRKDGSTEDIRRSIMAHAWAMVEAASQVVEGYRDTEWSFFYEIGYPTAAVGDVTVYPDAQTMALAQPTPAQIAAALVSALSLSLTQQTSVPDVRQSPSAQVLTLSQETLTVAVTQLASALSLSLAQQDPAILADRLVAVAALALTLAQQDPTIDIEAVIAYLLSMEEDDLWL